MSDKISYILEVNDQYTSSLKDFLTELDKITDKIKGVGTQEKKNQTARVSYIKEQREEFQRLKNWMHETRMTQTKSLFLERQLTQAKKQSALAEKDSAVAGAINLRTASQRRLINKRTIGDLNLIRVQQQQNINNALKADRMISARAYSAPSGAFTPTAFDPKTGKFVDSTLPQPSQQQQPSKRPSFFGNGGIVSVANVAKGMGYYRAIDMGASAPSKLHDVTLQMESLTNTFDALIPKTKGYEGETAKSQIEYLRGVSQQLGVKFADIADPYRKIMATGVADKQLAQQLTESVGGYSRLVGMDSGAFKGTMLAFEQMLTKQKIQAQEFNLQTQQMPGVKPIFYEAFRRILEKKGVKLSEKEVAPTFLKYMEAGALDSVPLLKEFAKVVKEDFWVDVMKKAQSTQAQENRLSNAFYNLAADIGTQLNPTLNETVVGLTEMIEATSQFGRDLKAIFEVPILKQFNDFFLKPILEGLKLLPSALMDLIKYIGQGAVFAIKGLITGNFEEVNNLSSELGKKWFPELNKSENPFNNQFTPIPMSPQEVLVKIVGENLPTGISIKQESRSYGMTPRPKTVIAGGL
jgi:tape measure domain-containing protein